MTKVKIIQISKNRWRIESDLGKILLDDILLYSKREAEDFVKSYVSTWQAWSYDVIVMNGGTNEND